MLGHRYSDINRVGFVYRKIFTGPPGPCPKWLAISSNTILSQMGTKIEGTLGCVLWLAAVFNCQANLIGPDGDLTELF